MRRRSGCSSRSAMWTGCRVPAPVGEDARIGVLERRVRELEAVVKGLTEEVLDLKALTIKLTKTAERNERPATTRPGTGRTAEPPVVRADRLRPPAECGEARAAAVVTVPAAHGRRSRARSLCRGDGPDHAARRDDQAGAAPQERVHRGVKRAPEPATGIAGGRTVPGGTWTR